MRDLKQIRSEIDAIDQNLVALFQRRLEVMDEVALAKKTEGVPLTDPAREEAILKRLEELAPACAEETRKLYSLIFSLAKERQKCAVPLGE